MQPLYFVASLSHLRLSGSHRRLRHECAISVMSAGSWTLSTFAQTSAPMLSFLLTVDGAAMACGLISPGACRI